MNYLSVPAFRQAIDDGAIIIDGRNPETFALQYIPGSINLIEKNVTKYALDLIKIDTPLVIIENESSTLSSSLLQLGYKNILGTLQGGVEEWVSAGEPIDMIITIEADELNMDIPYDDNMMIVDVRDSEDYESSHIANATSIPVQEFADVLHIASLDDNRNIYVHCGGGSRSILAASMIKSQGLHNIRVISDRYEDIIAQPNVQVVTSKKIEENNLN